MEWRKERARSERQHCGSARGWVKGEENSSNCFNMVTKLSSLRSQPIDMENLPEEIIEILEKIQKSPELQSILAEKLQIGGMPYVIYVPNCEFNFFIESQVNSSNFFNSKIPRFSPDHDPSSTRFARHGELKLSPLPTTFRQKLRRTSTLFAATWAKLKLNIFDEKQFSKISQAWKCEEKNSYQKKFINGWEFLLILWIFLRNRFVFLMKFFMHGTCK